MVKTPQQKASKTQEKRLAKQVSQSLQEDAKVQVGSGNQWYAKSDVVSQTLRIEAKTKVKESKTFSIKKEWLDKIKDETRGRDQIPVLAISFDNKQDYYVLDSEDVLNMIAELAELREIQRKVETPIDEPTLDKSTL